MVTRRGFVSAGQRRAFFATGNFKREPRATNPDGVTAFSYRDGRRLGKFENLQAVFKRFPSERKAFMRVIKFRRKTGVQVNTIKEIQTVKRAEKMAKGSGHLKDR